MPQAQSVLVLHGPNLNMLGQREPEIYGATTLPQLEELCRKTAAGLGLTADCRQSNSEAELIGWLHDSRGKHSGIIINAGAFSHTSVALLDALKIADLPGYEVHISNIYSRETFRHHSYLSAAVNGVICGFGIDGYIYALQALAKYLKDKQ